VNAIVRHLWAELSLYDDVSKHDTDAGKSDII
jgi:hypothetical protein